MRILCAIGLRGGPQLLNRLASLLGGDQELLLAHAIDTGPRHGLELFLRGPAIGPRRLQSQGESLDAAELAAGEGVLKEALEAGRLLGFRCEIVLLRGEPGAELVRAAAERAVDLIAIAAQQSAAPPGGPAPARRPPARPEGRHEPPPHPPGPPNPPSARIGHVARFVVDHAPCALLLLEAAGRAGENRAYPP